jgi:hypothetical protein
MDPALADALGLDASWRRAFAEVERLVGGRVVGAERQARWRPAWFLDVEVGSDLVPVYFRGDRGLGQGNVYGLEHEARVLQVLEAQGIPVPHVHGLCPDPKGIVMDRAPGRENLANADDEAERRAVLDHYMEILVEMHRIDVAAFEAIGLSRPTTARELGFADLPRWVEGFRKRKNRPEPLIEFVLGWLERNVPTHRTRATFVAGDSGQFLFDRGRVTAVLDLELAFLGDPMADLAGMRSRDLSEPLGDLARGFRRYEALSGEPIDTPTLHYHTVRFALNTPLAVAPMCAEPPPGLNLAQYLGWNLVYGRFPLEVIAQQQGIALAPPELPDPELTAFSSAHDALLAALEGGGSRSYEQDSAYRLAQYLREVDRRGPRLGAQNVEDVSRLVGRALHTSAEADAALEEFVLARGAERESEIVVLLHRLALRHEALLRPAMRELADVRFQPV